MNNSVKQELWLTNISDMNVTIGDLRISIPARSTINLLSKHYHFTYEEIKKSLMEGSLKKKSDKIKVSKGPAKPFELPPKEMSKRPMSRRNRTCVKVEEIEYEDFIFTDEQYAQQMSELFADPEDK